MATCNPQTLMDSAACFACLPEDVKQTIKLQLLCEILNAGGGGGGGVTSIIAGDGISVDQATGDVTVSLTGALPAPPGTVIVSTDNTGNVIPGNWSFLSGWVGQWGSVVYVSTAATQLDPNSGDQGMTGNFDFTGLVNLESVYISTGSNLQSVNVSGLPNLDSLEIYGASSLASLSGLGSNAAQYVSCDICTVLSSVTFDDVLNIIYLSLEGTTMLSPLNCPVPTNRERSSSDTSSEEDANSSSAFEYVGVDQESESSVSKTPN